MSQVNEDSSGKQQNVERLQKHLGQALPAVLAALYSEAEKEVDAGGLRLLTVDQVIENAEAFAAMMPLFGGVPFFTDDNGSYLFVHLGGPLEGRVSVWMEDYIYCTAFRSVSSLLEKLDAIEDADWEESLYGDYFTGCLKFEPQPAATAEEVEADRMVVKQLRELWDQARQSKSYDKSDDEIYLANIITLTPLEDAKSVREFLTGEHPAQFAIEWAGYTGECFVEDLAKITETYQCGLAYQSLARIGSARAKTILRNQITRCPKGHEASLARALKLVGVPTRHEIGAKQKHAFLVLSSSGEDWHIIGTSDKVIREPEQPIVVWCSKNKHEVEVALALTPAAIRQLKRQIESSPDPDKVWVRWLFVSRLATQFGQQVSFRVTKVVPHQVSRQETPYFRLAIDPETVQELDEVGRFGVASSDGTRFVFDDIINGDGTREFVWLCD